MYMTEHPGSPKPVFPPSVSEVVPSTAPAAGVAPSSLPSDLRPDGSFQFGIYLCVRIED